MLRNKNLLSLALILVLVATTSLTFAFWDSLSKEDNSNIQVGVGMTTIINEVVGNENQGKLIPVGAILGTNEVDQIVKEYNVVLSKQAKEPLYLDVLVSNILIGNKEYDGLINIDILHNPTIVDEEKVTVMLSMNNLEMDYSKVYNNQITFSVEFSVINNK